jgi:hypothetical protein
MQIGGSLNQLALQAYNGNAIKPSQEKNAGISSISNLQGSERSITTSIGNKNEDAVVVQFSNAAKSYLAISNPDVS